MPSPCIACPFTKTVEPGALGGSEPETCIGQAYGPFILPCHMACDFDDPEWKAQTVATPQCAGAAAFRAKVGIAPYLPSGIHKLPPHPNVFEGPVQFLAHHQGIGQDKALEQLLKTPPAELLKQQLARQDNIVFKPKDQS